jgi:hypothetical protein
VVLRCFENLSETNRRKETGAAQLRIQFEQIFATVLAEVDVKDAIAPTHGDCGHNIILYEADKIPREV